MTDQGPMRTGQGAAPDPSGAHGGGQGLSLSEHIARLLPGGTGRGDPARRASPEGPASALADLTQRIEAAEARSTLAIAGVDQSILGLLDRLERSETHQSSARDELTRLVDDLRVTHEALGEKVRELEADDTSQQNLEALKTLEQALASLADHVHDENARQQDEAEAIKGRVEAGFGDLHERVEAIDTRVEGRLTEAAQRMKDTVEAAAREQSKVTRRLAGRVDGLEGEMAGARETTQGLANRVGSVEQAVETERAKSETLRQDVGQVQSDVSGALGSVEDTLVQMQQRLNAAEQTTNSALQRLDQTYASLDSRIEAVAQHANPDLGDELRAEFEARFQGLSQELRGSVDATRQDIARQIEAAMPAENLEQIHKLAGTLDTVEDRLRAVEGRNDAAASETVREEVASLARRLDARVDESEERSANAIEQVGEQVAGMAQRLQARQDEAFETMSNRLDETARAQDARMSDALANVSERFERIREQTSEQISPVQRAIASLASRLESLERVGEAPDATPSLHDGEAGLDAPFEPGLPQFDATTDASPPAPEPQARAHREYRAELPDESHEENSFDPLSAPDRPAAARAEPDDDVFETEPEAVAPDDGTDRRDDDHAGPGNHRLVEDTEAGDYIARARAAALRAAADNGRSGNEIARRGSSRLPMYAAASIVVLATAGAAGGYLHLRGKQVPSGDVFAEPTGATEANASDATPAGNRLASLVGPTRDTERLSDAPLADQTAPVPPVDSVETVTPPLRSEPVTRALSETPDSPDTPDVARAASTAGDPGASMKATPQSPDTAQSPRPRPSGFAPIPPMPDLESAAAAGDRIAMYQLGRQHLDAGEYAPAAELIRNAANKGLPSAQYRLAKLHERGTGVARDLTKAREWTERAASGGNARAMHDLAVFLAEGEGGEQSYARAVEWFRKAAEYGVVDSQFNLALLYEEGLGISPNLTEALFWFSVAKAEGDDAAGDKAQDLKERVSREAAERVSERVARWEAKTPPAIANGDIPEGSWRTAGPDQIQSVQTALRVLGYTPGPADGVLGPETRSAIRAYQRNEDLPVSGQIDVELVEALNAETAARG